jgi:hypothetical protein
MIHLTTIILPLWFQTLVKLKLEQCKIPHDVSMRWNSMFDMLVFHRVAVDDIAENKAANLCQYELTDEEWWITEQLHDTLKVSICAYMLSALFSQIT